MPSAPPSPVMPSEPNVLPVSPAPGSATSFTSAVPGPHLNVDHNTPAARQPQALQGSSSTVQPFSKILSDIGAIPSEPDVDNAPSECNPPLTDRAFRYQRRDASRAARIIHAGMFDPTETLSTFDPNDSIEPPAQTSVPSRLLFPYSPSRELNTQHVAVTCPPMTHAPTAIARPPFSAGARFSLRDFPPLIPPRALCSMNPPSPLRSRTASAAGPSRSTAPPATFTAASADTSPVALRAVSNSGETRSRGLCPDAPVPSRTLTPGPPGPPSHLAQLTAVWHTLSAATQAELGHISSDRVAQGLVPWTPCFNGQASCPAQGPPRSETKRCTKNRPANFGPAISSSPLSKGPSTTSTRPSTASTPRAWPLSRAKPPSHYLRIRPGLQLPRRFPSSPLHR